MSVIKGQFMKITESKKGNTGAVGKSGSSGSAKQAKTAGENPSAVASKAAVSVSSNSKIAETLKADASQRSAKVAQLKLDVEGGQYEADSYETAGKILQNLTDYSLA